MRVNAIDHVNIVTDDLDGTCTFYERLLGLTRTTSAGQSIGYRSAWMSDTHGNALIHVLWNDPAKQTTRGHTPGGPTGAVHHIALRCTDFEGMQRIAGELGIEHRVNDGQAGLRQIFVHDPNNVLLELIFPDE
ncbi:VOC family protein [Nocardia sp. BMG111209]|uniref:VOC family protein n=1 Tax=Nocardia sp. BMG111209 TaxID=1160137 RepID=UPI000375755D|nr:VOC family protein [Nocardia sp. BMG111209]